MDTTIIICLTILGLCLFFCLGLCVYLIYIDRRQKNEIKLKELELKKEEDTRKAEAQAKIEELAKVDSKDLINQIDEFLVAADEKEANHKQKYITQISILMDKVLARKDEIKSLAEVVDKLYHNRDHFTFDRACEHMDCYPSPDIDGFAFYCLGLYCDNHYNSTPYTAHFSTDDHGPRERKVCYFVGGRHYSFRVVYFDVDDDSLYFNEGKLTKDTIDERCQYGAHGWKDDSFYACLVESLTFMYDGIDYYNKLINDYVKKLKEY